MKLRLPHKLQAALVAALATVGFALPQAQAANTVISNASQSAAVLVTGDITLNSISSTMAKSSGTEATPTQTNYRDSFTYTPANIGAGNGATYTLNFTVTDIVAGATAQGMTIDFFTLNGGGKPQNSENGYKATVALTMSEQETPVYSAEHTILTYTGNNNYTGSAYEGNPAITPVSQASVSKLELQNVEWKAGTYTLTITFAQDSQHTGGCFGGVGNIALLCSTISTWQGTEGQHQWVAANFSPEFVSGGDAIFGEAECKTVTVDEAVSAGQVAVNEAGYIFTLNNTLTANSLAIEDGASLNITGSGDMSISSLAGAGDFVKDSSGTLVLNGNNSSYTGGITVNAGLLSFSNVNALGSGSLTVNEGASIHIAARNSGTALPTNLSVAGDGYLRLMTDQTGSGDGPANIDLKTVSAQNLLLHAEGGDANGYNSRFIYKSGSNLDGVGHLFFDGAQMWVQADMDFTNAVTFGATTYYETAAAFNKAALRVGNGNAPVAKFSGPIGIQDTLKAGWQGNGELVFAGDVTGTAAIDLASFNGNGKFTVSGDASTNFSGTVTSAAAITLNVTDTGSLRIGSGSNLAGAVTLDGALISDNAEGEANATTIGGAVTGTGALTQSGAGTTKVTGDTTGFHGSIDVQAGELNVMNIAADTSLSVKDITIGTGATMGVYTDTVVAEANEGKVTMAANTTLKAGSGATLNADLEMQSGSTLTVADDDAWKTGGLTMGSSVYLNTGNLLGEGDLTTLNSLGFGDYYYLFSDVENLYINDAQVGKLDFEDWQHFNMDANQVFTNLNPQTYALVYNWDNGANVGSVALTLLPEPTTGTLSLLALCALAARRRRK